MKQKIKRAGANSHYTFGIEKIIECFLQIKGKLSFSRPERMNKE